MIELLVAFLFVHFDAAWGWWVGYGVACALSIFVGVTRS
jgi:hypothetical protein